MRIKPVLFLLCLQCLNVAPWAMAADEQVVVQIPIHENEPPLDPVNQTNLIWESGDVIHIQLEPGPLRLDTEKVTMPPMVGQLLRIEPSIPIAGARASWLAFSESEINLCAVRRQSTEVRCKALMLPNMASTRVTVEQRGPAGNYALRYHYRNPDQYRAVIDIPMLVPMANAIAQAIAQTSLELGQSFTGSPH